MSVRDRRDIELLVSWALIDNGLGRMFEDGRLSATWRELGTRVSSSSSSWTESAPSVKHDDAIAVMEAISQLHPDCAALIVSHGRIGDRPDWIEEGVGHARQMIDGRGRLLWRWNDPTNKSKARSGRSPRMEWVGETKSNVDFYRARYDLWWIGLHDLVGPLNAVMTDHEATGPRAADKPWLVPSTVFRPDGTVMEKTNDSAARISRLHKRGDVEITSPVEGNIHSSGSAALGSR